MKSFVVLCLVGLAAVHAFEEKPCPPKNFFTAQKASDCCDDAKNCDLDATSRIVDHAYINKYDEFMKYSNEYLVRSYEYFFLAAQFGTYGKDRPGFHKLLKGLSDSAWSKGIEMIQEMTKRGFSHQFESMEEQVEGITSNATVSELAALAKAAEIEKNLLIKANDIHRHHSHASYKPLESCGYDAGLSHYMVEEIVMGKTETVRSLVGHANQLKKLFTSDQTTYPLSLYLFDQHLQ